LDLIQAIILGIVQGLTEWLPVSSTAHLRIVPAVLGWPDPGASFTAVIQIGTVAAVLAYFWQDLLRAFGGWFRSLRGEGKGSPEARLGWAVFYGTIPVVVFGFLFRHQIRGDVVRSLYVIAASLAIVGIVMVLAERLGKKRRTVEDVTVRDGWVVGLWQALALIPGASRSGSTISGAMFSGFDRPSAARFSFLLSFPSILGAGVFELVDARDQILGQQLAPVLVSTVVSFVVGYASIAFLMRFLQRHSIITFVVYRFMVAALLLFLIQQGIVTPYEMRPDTVAGAL
jgi:undecaprenyl-diphosphatase